MDIAFPMKGLNTNKPLNVPDDSSSDMLNALPFDRDYIRRGGIRAGLSKFVPTRLGNGAQPILLTGQVTTALDPSSIAPSTLLLNEGFAYADGNLNTVSGGTWAANNSATSFGGTALSTSIVSGSKIVTSTNVGARYTPGVVLGPSYVIKMRVKVQHVDQSYDVKIGFRSTNGNPSAGMCCLFERSGSGGIHVGFFTMNAFVKVGTDTTTAAGVVSDNTDFIVELRVNGNACSAWLNGLQILAPQVVTNFAGNSVFGFMVTAASQTVTIDDFQVYAGSPLASYRSTSLVAVCGGNVYQGDPSSFALASGGSAVLSETVKPQMGARAGRCYIVDSQNPMRVLDLASQTVKTWGTFTGDVIKGSETAVTLGACTLCCVWRDRLVVAAPAGYPQNFFMSRQSDPLDWDYGQTDAAAAVAGNASKAGAIGEPLNCLIPWTDDVLILGGDHSIYKVAGDIAAGGSILLVSDSVGTLGPDAFDTDPNGNVYLAGSGGLYRMTPGGGLENISSETVKAFFANINRVTHYVCLTYDRDRNGLNIHVTPANTGPATHLFFDVSTSGFYPIQYPDVAGPLTSVVFDGDGPTDRQLLLAGRDGYIRKVDPTATTDDGTAITSYVMIGPYRPAGDAALSVLEALELILGDEPAGFTESDFGLTLSVVVGKDAYTALNNPERTVSFTLSNHARRKRLLNRVSGGTFFFKIAGLPSKVWSLEKLVALFTEGGLQRRY